MGYDRYPRGNPGYRPDRDQDYGRDYGAPRDSYSGARDYATSGYDRDDDDRGYRGGYGARQERGGPDRGYARPYGGSYMHDGHRDTDFGRNRGMYDQDRGQRGYGRQPQQGYGRQQQQGYGRQPQGYDYDDRGFFDRAGDEVRSWFGDDDAERRREMDRRYDERYGNATDSHYDSWRRERIGELDRDYDEYRRENASKFHNEFATFRSERETQRSSLNKVTEHMEVVGSDGAHVGTVDKVRGDRIILTKSDPDAGGRHHSIPSRWIQSVDDKVTIRKTADQAKDEWRDEERNQAMFRDRDNQPGYGQSHDQGGTSGFGSTNLNRSFKGTY
ncbi:DUF2171 domain-containing protein [Sphingomonas japonica]|uniref:Osmotically-inducible protein OsmY n=1 Tax=Sphingomonas japonica TaxID=511662 RepID=A0ABX0U5Z1_9SPHN|nr:DUF2171 domain-containing protein [Sphingomonas japonica]NIJ24198.1 osmotically-inducible protein OsmY [Sphingomonas japonica]